MSDAMDFSNIGVEAFAFTNPVQQEEDFFSFGAEGASTFSNDVFSVLSDSVGNADLAKELYAVARKLTSRQRAAYAGFLGRVKDAELDETPSYVAESHRGKITQTNKPMSETANPDQVVTALRLEAATTIPAVVNREWKLGHVVAERQTPSGFPVFDAGKVRRQKIDDFINKISYSPTLAGRQNPFTTNDHTQISVGLQKMRKLPDSGLATVSSDVLKKPLATKFEKIAQYVKLEREEYQAAIAAVPKDQASFIGAVTSRQQKAKAALLGRKVRGEDNAAAVCAPWYRFANVPKSINKFMTLQAMTKGRVNNCPAQYDGKFVRDSNAMNLMLETSGDFTAVMTQAVGLGYATQTSSNPPSWTVKSAIIQVNVIDEKPENLASIVKTLAQNSFSAGWAIHDGHIFIGPKGYPSFLDVVQYPNYLATVAYVNNLRTLGIYDVLDVDVPTPGLKIYNDLDDTVPLVSGGLIAANIDLGLDFGGDEHTPKVARTE